MISVQKDRKANFDFENETNKSEEKTSGLGTFSASLDGKVDLSGIEADNLDEKLIQAEFTVNQLQNMVKTTAIYVNQLAVECQKKENDCAAIMKEKHRQNEYQIKEIKALETELEHLKKILDIRNEELEKAHNKNANLKNAIIANRYKIFHMHYNGLNKARSEESESNSTTLDTTSDDTEASLESSELSDET